MVRSVSTTVECQESGSAGEKESTEELTCPIKPCTPMRSNKTNHKVSVGTTGEISNVTMLEWASGLEGILSGIRESR
jgi:hypothetical protein